MKTLQEKIAVMQAAEDGADIEATFYGNNSWRVVKAPQWNWVSFDYRVAEPKLREHWENVYKFGRPVRHKTKEEADKEASPNRIECIHYREVTGNQDWCDCAPGGCIGGEIGTCRKNSPRVVALQGGDG